MDENHTLIYKILKRLERSMDYPEFDTSLISAEALGTSKTRWACIMEMLVDEGYIKGVNVTQDMTMERRVSLLSPVITLKGLDYLSDNSFMKRVQKTVSGINDMIP